jgi:hypothetical protein
LRVGIFPSCSSSARLQNSARRYTSPGSVGPRPQGRLFPVLRATFTSIDGTLRPNPTSPYSLQIYTSCVLRVIGFSPRSNRPPLSTSTFIVPITVPAGDGTSFVRSLQRPPKTTSDMFCGFLGFPGSIYPWNSGMSLATLGDSMSLTLPPLT